MSPPVVVSKAVGAAATALIAANGLRDHWTATASIALSVRIKRSSDTSSGGQLSEPTLLGRPGKAGR